jgi:hypothetical protein
MLEQALSRAGKYGTIYKNTTMLDLLIILDHLRANPLGKHSTWFG